MHNRSNCSVSSTSVMRLYTSVANIVRSNYIRFDMFHLCPVATCLWRQDCRPPHCTRTSRGRRGHDSLPPPSTTPFFVADDDTRRLWCYKAGNGYVHDKHNLQMTMKHQTIEGTIAMERNHLRVTSCDRTSSKVQPHSQQRQRNFRNPRRQTRGKGWHVPWLNRVDAMHDM